MQKTTMQLPEIKLIGITARTNNKLEMDPDTAKIGGTIQQYFHQQLAEKMTQRKNPGITYCVYTEYESDFTGDYTYFIGEEVTSFANLPKIFTELTIAPQTYAKYTSDAGPMPLVCINMWQKIWQMTTEEFGGNRSYQADFELYDQRAKDPQNVVLDIFIGVDK